MGLVAGRERAEASAKAQGLGGVNSVISIALEEYLDRYDEQQKKREIDDLLREAVPALKAIAVAVTELLAEKRRERDRES